MNLNSLRPARAEESLQPLKSVSLKGNKLIKTLLNYFKRQYNKVMRKTKTKAKSHNTKLRHVGMGNGKYCIHVSCHEYAFCISVN